MVKLLVRPVFGDTAAEPEIGFQDATDQPGFGLSGARAGLECVASEVESLGAVNR